MVRTTPAGRFAVNRRIFLSGSLAMGVGLSPVMAHAGLSQDRSLRFLHLHTGETTDTTYVVGGRYDLGALRAINWILRDWRTDEQTPMDVGLLDFLHDLRVTLGTDEPYQIISGYRSPRTNAALAAKSNGVAKKSLHMRGMAADVRLAKQDLDAVVQAARAMKRGGVGRYVRSNFVHIDVGRPRAW